MGQLSLWCLDVSDRQPEKKQEANMRWLFANPNDNREQKERQQIIARIEAWWRAFADKKDSLTALFTRKARWDLPAWMEANLQAIHPSIMWEFGPAVRTKGHRLVI